MQREGRPGVLVLKCASMILIEGIMEPGARCKHVVMYSYWPGVLKAERALLLDCDIWILMRTYISLYMYIYISLFLETVANNRRISLVYVVRRLLSCSEKTLILHRVFSRSSADIRTNVGNCNRFDSSIICKIEFSKIGYNYRKHRLVGMVENWILEFWKKLEKLRFVKNYNRRGWIGGIWKLSEILKKIREIEIHKEL